jgi:hypothetical protein
MGRKSKLKAEKRKEKAKDAKPKADDDDDDGPPPLVDQPASSPGGGGSSSGGGGEAPPPRDIGVEITQGHDPRLPMTRFIRASAQKLLDANKGKIGSTEDLFALIKAAWKGQTSEQKARWGGRAFISCCCFWQNPYFLQKKHARTHSDSRLTPMTPQRCSVKYDTRGGATNRLVVVSSYLLNPFRRPRWCGRRQQQRRRRRRRGRCRG